MKETNMIISSFSRLCAAAAAATLVLAPAQAAVDAQKAAELRTALTPLGADKAGNKDGSIPAWTGGVATSTPAFVGSTGRRDRKSVV